MRADEDRQRVEGNERNRNAEDEHVSDFRTMPQCTPIASAPSGWRSIVFTILAWSLAGWALIAAVWWVGSSEKIEMFSAKKPSTTYDSR
jgi:hypothetical protein